MSRSNNNDSSYREFVYGTIPSTEHESTAELPIPDTSAFREEFPEDSPAHGRLTQSMAMNGLMMGQIKKEIRLNARASCLELTKEADDCLFTLGCSFFSFLKKSRLASECIESYYNEALDNVMQHIADNSNVRTDQLLKQIDKDRRVKTEEFKKVFHAPAPSPSVPAAASE
ncbi:hypothetical protein H696_00944 [Fonticula alba]|uniref:Uncharacterized protein n=1 Tax=Fonticula alba TaxID=691883 RepID=A0A058ZIR3_FONAL|nr:hypothetical protein H696_00944 [Fonticula alba]KCV73407.1 hypothetical protein H696_00944 [Fonticula alba]|eukprot:XP_009493108.1 hypothetical protein H696_00944 [Fonticula alba]